MEGSTLTFIFRLFNRIPGSYFIDRCHLGDPRIYCRAYHQCIGPDALSSAAVLATFQPIKLSDNGTYISFGIADYTPDPVIITGEYYCWAGQY